MQGIPLQQRTLARLRTTKCPHAQIRRVFERLGNQRADVRVSELDGAPTSCFRRTTRTRITVYPHHTHPHSSVLFDTSLLFDESMRILGLNTANAFRHPGFFYHLAAGVAEKRGERFLVIDRAGPQAVANTQGTRTRRRSIVWLLFKSCTPCRTNCSRNVVRQTHRVRRG